LDCERDKVPFFLAQDLLLSPASEAYVKCVFFSLSRSTEIVCLKAEKKYSWKLLWNIMDNDNSMDKIMTPTLHWYSLV